MSHDAAIDAEDISFESERLLGTRQARCCLLGSLFALRHRNAGVISVARPHIVV
jgi:hypothetical protein